MTPFSLLPFFWLTVTVKATLVLCAIAIIALLPRRVSAAFRHFLWALGLGLVVGLPFLVACLPSLRIALPPRAVTRRSVTPPRVGPVTPPAAPTGLPSVSLPAPPETPAPAVTPMPPPVVPVSVVSPPAWPVVVSAVWLFGAILTLLPWAFSVAKLGRFRHQSQPVTEGLLAFAAMTAQNTLCVPRVEIRRTTGSGLAPVPMGWGWLRPVVLLPLEAEAWPVERLRAVLLHEMAHVRRHDWATQTLARFACALYWFHPLVWLAARQLRAEAECACDDLVLAAGMPATDYAQHLLDVARAVGAGRGVGSGAVAMAQSPKIESRLRAVLALDRPRRPLERPAAVGLLSLALLLTLPLAAMRPVAQAQGAFFVATGPPVERRVARGILTFISLQEVKTDKNPNGPITMNITLDASKQEVYQFTDARTGLTFGDGPTVRAAFQKLRTQGDKKRVGATPYRIPPTLAAAGPSQVVFFTADQQKAAHKLAQEAAAWNDLLRRSPVIATDADVMASFAKMNNQIPPLPMVDQMFTSEGAKKMRAFTMAHRGEIMGILLDGRLLSAPRIEGTISGEGELAGGFRSLAEAQALAKRLNAPAPTVSAADQLQLRPGFTLRYAATITDLRSRQMLLDEYRQMQTTYRQLLKQNPHFQPVPEEALRPFAYFESRRPKVRHVVLTVSSADGHLLCQQQEGGDTFSQVYDGHGTQLFHNGRAGRTEPGLPWPDFSPLPAVGLPYVPLLRQATLIGSDGSRQVWQAECTSGQTWHDSTSGLVQATDEAGTWKVTDIDSPEQHCQYGPHQPFQGLWIASQMRLTQYQAAPMPAVSPRFRSFPEFMAFIDARRIPTGTYEYRLISASDTPVNLDTLTSPAARRPIKAI